MASGLSVLVHVYERTVTHFTVIIDVMISMRVRPLMCFALCPAAWCYAGVFVLYAAGFDPLGFAVA